MGQNLRRQKIHLPPCAFWVSRNGIWKVHLSECVFLVFWWVLVMCIFWIFLVHFRCIFCVKVYFSLRFWYLCLDEVYFCLRLCGNRTRTFTAGVFSYPRVVHFFGKRIFGRQLWKQNPHFCCMCILAAYVVLKSSVPFICFRIVIVSTRFGELKYIDPALFSLVAY